MRAGKLQFWVTLDNKDENEPVTGSFIPCSPAGAWCAIEPLSPADDERSVHYAVTMRFRDDVSMDTRITYIDPQNLTHYLFVKGFQNVGLQGVELRLYCDEVWA